MHIVLMAVVLYILVAKLGGVRIEDHRWKVLVLVVLVAFAEGAVRLTVESELWAWIAPLLITIALGFALALWLRVARAAAAKIVAIFYAVRLVVGFGLLWIIRAAA